ncbi:unnamed protein product [Amoebophrya sp. A120]|nr:unnamed protein product [Amoebophrya sp. A120]|eukprot:GSA120T00023735001.1
MSSMMRPLIIFSLLLAGVVDAVQQSVAIENDAEMYSAEPSPSDPFFEGGAVNAEKERTPAAASGKTSRPSAFTETSAMARLQKLFTSAKSRVHQVKEAQKIASASQQHFKTLVLDLALDYNVRPMTVLYAARFSSLDTDGNDVLEGAEFGTCPLSADLNEDKKLDFPEYDQHCSSQQQNADSAASASSSSFTEITHVEAGDMTSGRAGASPTPVTEVEATDVLDEAAFLEKSRGSESRSSFCCSSSEAPRSASRPGPDPGAEEFVVLPGRQEYEAILKASNPEQKKEEEKRRKQADQARRTNTWGLISL